MKNKEMLLIVIITKIYLCKKLLIIPLSQVKDLTGDFMEKIVKVAQLFDIYGALLNEKQRDVINCYYNEDLSLQEIADNTARSKQAISDMMARSVDKLFEFEDELSLLKSREELKDSLIGIRELMESSNYELAISKITDVIDKI